MEYRQLGRSGILVSTVTLGTMTFGGKGGYRRVGELEVDQARQLVDRALSAGVNLIDTADCYSYGRSEEIVGEVLKGRRDDILIATKVGVPTGHGPNDEGLSRDHIVAACERSLRRLQTDHIDLYQAHQWDGKTPPEETMDALDTLVHQGKVRYIGCSNYSAWHLMKALGISDRLGLQRFVSHQIYYSMIGREAEYELVPAAIDQGLGLLIWSPLAGGLMSGKYRRGQAWPEGARHTTDWGEPPVSDWDPVYDVIEVLVNVAERHGASPAAVALAYLIGKPAVTSVVVGARDLAQLEINLGAAELALDPADQAELDRVSQPTLLYPYWHQAANVTKRLSPADESLLRQSR